MVEAAQAEFKKAQAALVDAYQQEYFCDDVSPPESAYGWSFAEFDRYFKTGGMEAPQMAAAPTPLPAATPALPAPPAPPVPSARDGTLMEFLRDTDGLAHLTSAMEAVTWEECSKVYAEGRPKLIAHLAKTGAKLADRQKFVTAFVKASKPATEQPGGGRAQVLLSCSY